MGCSVCGKKYPRATGNGLNQPGPQPVAPYVNPNRRVSVQGVIRAPVTPVPPPKTS